MRKLFLAAALGLLVSACSTVSPIKHEGRDTYPPASKELAPVVRVVNRTPFSVEAVAQAAKDHKIVLLHFHAPWCKWCTKMSEDVWSHPEVATVVNKAYVFLDINMSESAENLAMFVKYSALFGEDLGIPLTVAVFPHISPEDESVMPAFDINTIQDVDVLFASSLFISYSGYTAVEDIYQDLYNFGKIYNKKFDKK